MPNVSYLNEVSKEWSGRTDLNRRPLGPEPSALASCATPREFCDSEIHPEVATKRSNRGTIFATANFIPKTRPKEAFEGLIFAS